MAEADISVGIIGDGQLGMLLCESGTALGITTVMLTSDTGCDAAQRASQAIQGAMDDSEALSALITCCDVITYEREDLPAQAITALRAAENAGTVVCYPPLSVIELLQDKARQKRWLADNALATLPFVVVDGSAESLQGAAAELGFPLVQKALRGGFDGRGVQLLRDPDALQNAWPGETLFEQYAGKFREVAVLFVRGRNGDTRHFGPVDMTFEADYAVLDTVTAPADLSVDIEQAAIDLATRAVEAFDGVGVFGVEMFLLDNDTVLINEISPRVHNAGHYSLDACASSQFEQHLRAICGLPLNDTSLRQAAAMKNLLCTPALRLEDQHRPAAKQLDDNGALVYWYGKSPARLMRKLGHVSALASTPQDARKLVEQSWESIQIEAQESR
ncbi:MAG: 5-(carboxyamino)imidazole ribonucleotide synthase [Congregibacter sp.]